MYLVRPWTRVMLAGCASRREGIIQMPLSCIRHASWIQINALYLYVLDSYDITLVSVSHYIMGGIQAGGAYCSGRSFSVKGVSITAKSHNLILFRLLKSPQNHLRLPPDPLQVANLQPLPPTPFWLKFLHRYFCVAYKPPPPSDHQMSILEPIYQ